MPKTIIVTGGCGFIGHHFVEHLVNGTDWNIVVLDKLSYASSGLARLRDTGCLSSERVRIFTNDLVNPLPEGLKREIGTDVNYIVHMAAETHVENSIKDPAYLSETTLIRHSTCWSTREVYQTWRHSSTSAQDEVFGPALDGRLFKEWDRHKPTNPYSASKSAAEQICIAYETRSRCR